MQPRRPLSGLALECWNGVSVWETLEQARQMARGVASLGRCVARLEIPAGAEVRSQRTFRTEGHHTLWAEPEVLLRCVASVVLVDPVE